MNVPYERIFMPGGHSIVIQYFTNDQKAPSREVCARLRDFYAWKVQMHDEFVESPAPEPVTPPSPIIEPASSIDPAPDVPAA